MTLPSVGLLKLVMMALQLVNVVLHLVVAQQVPVCLSNVTAASVELRVVSRASRLTCVILFLFKLQSLPGMVSRVSMVVLLRVPVSLYY